MGDDRCEYAVEPVSLPEPLQRIVGQRSWSRDAVGELDGEIHRLHAAGTRDLYLKDSLDNMLLAEGAVTGWIDLARVGVADRYQDLAILTNCLNEFEPGLRSHFLTAYGIAEPDGRKLRLHCRLDKLF